MTFQSLINYAGYEHVLNAVPCFVHPLNGNLYGVAIEKQGGLRQNLSVYRVRPGVDARELVHRYVGGVDSAAQIAAGGCVIHPDGTLEVWASAVPPGVPPITKTGFVGVWDRVAGVDAPYPLLGALQDRIAALEARLAALPPTVTGGVFVVPPQSPPNEGGEIILQDGNGGEPWHIDVFRGHLRLHIGGRVVQEWAAV